MKQVFLNIILNALQAMPDGGELNISLQEVRKPAPGITIGFSDTGVGMSSDQLRRIYDLFYSTKKEGTGVGLTVSYKIIREHGGQIEVSSIQGKGTVFNIFIPKTFNASI